MKYLLLIFFISTVFAEDMSRQKMPPMHHLYDIKASEKISIPENFPLDEQQRITCKTCHGIKDIKQKDFKKIDTQAEDFFREGPYQTMTDFCFRCHDKKSEQRNSIHKMLDEKKQIIKSQCLYCHETFLDPEKDIRKEDIRLRLPARDICYGCHLDSPHINALGHRKKPSREMRKRIVEYEKYNNIILPLSQQQEVICISCHSPHQKGLISADKAAGKQAPLAKKTNTAAAHNGRWSRIFSADKQQRLKQLEAATGRKYTLKYQAGKGGKLLRLPIEKGQLCLVCHDFEN